MSQAKPQLNTPEKQQWFAAHASVAQILNAVSVGGYNIDNMSKIYPINEEQLMASCTTDALQRYIADNLNMMDEAEFAAFLLARL